MLFKTQKLPALVLLASTALLMVACSKTPAPEPEPRGALTRTVASSSLSPALELAGEVRARVESRLGFQVGGRITRRDVELGSVVRKGQVLASIDTRDLELAEQASRSQLESARSDLALAEADLKRVSDLRQKGFVSESEIDRRKVAVDAARSRFEQSQADLSLRGNQRGYASLIAPADGVVVQVLGDVGQVIAAGEPVLRLALSGAREIEVVVPEDRVALVRQAQASVSLWAAPQHRLPARLREMSAAADPMTRTFQARFAVEAPASALQLGQSAILHLAIPTRLKQITLPTSALFEEHGKTLVWVVSPKDSTVHKRAVTLAGTEGTEVGVAGLQPGETVVIAGVHVLVEGQKVKPLPASVQ